jgi:hypothetical protein
MSRSRRGDDMWRIELAVVLALTFILSPLAAEAQQPARVPRIGYLGSKVVSPQNHAAFLQGLRDLGYVEGRNVVIEYRDTLGKYDIARVRMGRRSRPRPHGDPLSSLT